MTRLVDGIETLPRRLTPASDRDEQGKIESAKHSAADHAEIPGSGVKSSGPPPIEDGRSDLRANVAFFGGWTKDHVDAIFAPPDQMVDDEDWRYLGTGTDEVDLCFGFEGDIVVNVAVESARGARLMRRADLAGVSACSFFGSPLTTVLAAYGEADRVNNHLGLRGYDFGEDSITFYALAYDGKVNTIDVWVSKAEPKDFTSEQLNSLRENVLKED